MLADLTVLTIVYTLRRVQRHSSIEWDHGKAAANLRKHGVSFEAAAHVLLDDRADQFHEERIDPIHSTESEDRWITIGSSPINRSLVLVIVWTESESATRVISARKASPRERKAYEEKRTH